MSAAPVASVASRGVIFPATNVGHLMLRADLVEAARAGTFHLYAVSCVDEAIALLTGLEAGVEDAQGGFPARPPASMAACRRGWRNWLTPARPSRDRNGRSEIPPDV